jgi:hypothetical protein
VEGLDFGETFAHVAYLVAIRILLAFATSKGFKLYQMDVKSVFRNGAIYEEVFVSVISRSEKEGTKPPHVFPGCSNHTYSNNMISRFHVQ